MLKRYFPLVLFFYFFVLGNIYSQNTAIPDANFEQALIDLQIDKDGVVNGSVATADISGVTYLDVRYNSIGDLTGIEDFTSLVILYCSGNPITSIDVSNAAELIELWCEDTQLENLDLNNNIALTMLVGYGNNLNSLFVNGAISLKQLYCENNNLTSLDVSQNIALDDLSCGNNQLNNLDVGENTDLRWLYCSNNNLASLDLSKNMGLFGLTCSDNQLTILDVRNGNNSSISSFNATNNPLLECIEVDSEADANAGIGSYASWLKDATASYSEDCENNLGVDDEILAEGLSLYPNPVSNTLLVESKVKLKKIEIYSILGQKIKQINSKFNSISTENLSRGIYMIKISSEKGTTVRKLIKK